MKSVILGLSALAVVAFAANTPDNYYPDMSEWESFKIDIDWKEIQETADSIDKKWDAYEAYEKKWSMEQARDLKKALQNAYKDTVGKVSMEWGKLIEPLVDHVGEAFDNKNATGVCDAECAVKCWRPDRFDRVNRLWTYGFNNTCFTQGCGCEFKLSKKMSEQTKKEMAESGKKIEKDLAQLAKYGEELASEARDILVPALEKYAKNTATLQNEYLKTVRATAIQDLGCNAPCVNSCTSGYTTCFFALSSCISQCACAGLDEVIDLSHGSYNFPSLMLYAQGDARAINTFYRNKDLF